MFIVIEKQGGWDYASIVTDENGNNKVFANIEYAQVEADDCQDGIVVGDNETFTKEQVLDILIAMDMAINPETYPSSHGLGTEDFLDAALSKASQLGIKDEFKKASEDYKLKYPKIE